MLWLNCKLGLKSLYVRTVEWEFSSWEYVLLRLDHHLFGLYTPLCLEYIKIIIAFHGGCFLFWSFLVSWWFNSRIVFAGSCFRSSDVYVHMHILFPVQNWNADVLFTDAQANKLGQLAYDMLVSFVILSL